MTRAQIKTLMASFGIQTALHHFPDEQIATINPPYLTWDFPGSDDLIADNTNYYKVDELTIDLYLDNMDFSRIDTIGTALNNAGLVYERTDTWIETEKLYQIEYITEVQIDG